MEIDKLREKYGDIGSGYPSDDVTRRFLNKLIQEGELPPYVRKTWNTVKKEPKRA